MSRMNYFRKDHVRIKIAPAQVRKCDVNVVSKQKQNVMATYDWNTSIDSSHATNVRFFSFNKTT
jgi:hypothetical protein